MRMFVEDYYPLYIPKRTTDNDKYYAAAGRALALATAFEENLKILFVKLSLSTTLEDFPDWLTREKDLSAFVQRAYDKKSMSGKVREIVKRYNKNVDLENTLIESCNARNAIAHDVTLNIDFRINNQEDGINKILSDLKEKVEKVAVGHLIVSGIITLITHGITPKEETIAEYLNKISLWVCDCQN